MKNEKGFLYKISEIIVEKRKLFFLIILILILFSFFSKNLVNIEYGFDKYLPDSTETKKALGIMEEEFNTYGVCNFEVRNITLEQAYAIRDELSSMDGIFNVEFNSDKTHYNNDCALFSITFDYNEKDERCLELIDNLKEYFTDYDYIYDTTLGDQEAESLIKEMLPIKIIVVIVVVLVLIFTSTSFAEVPALLIVFGIAAVLQMGTNFVFGTISYISDSVSVVLQLALSLDYAVIFMSRFKEEYKDANAEEASINALKKAIPEISGSSLTTIGGLTAMIFMKFGIGADLGLVLIKAIIISIISVFIVMPGLVVYFAPLMDKTKHKNFVPQIPFVGKFAYKTRFIIAPMFFLTIVAAYFVSNKMPLDYTGTKIAVNKTSELDNIKKEIEDNFGYSNIVAICVPSGDPDKEKALIDALEESEEVQSITALSNTEAIGGYSLTDKLTPREFSESLNIDYNLVLLIYAAYSVDNENYAKVVNGLNNYRVPLIDMFEFLYKEVKAGYVSLNEDDMAALEDANRMINYAKDHLQGENYSRIVLDLSLPVESDKTEEFIEYAHTLAGFYYNPEDVVFAGESVAALDLKSTFDRDNRVVTIISILTVLVVLLFTFKSVGLPLLLILVIQGSIWINFSFNTLQHDYCFFLAYLIVSSIQMGANIDYAIVISSRYMDLRKTMLRKETVINTMNQTLPTIVTSGATLAIIGIILGRLTSNYAIFCIGKTIGRGTIISIIITMLALPQILLVGDRIIEKTYFNVKLSDASQSRKGVMHLGGMVNGYLNGEIKGMINADFNGEINAVVNNTVEMIKDQTEDYMENSDNGND